MRFVLACFSFLFAAPVLALSITAVPAAPTCAPLLNHEFKTIKGQPAKLCDYAGKVVLVVNTASYCGYTTQYEGLQKLHDQYKDKGLVVLGVPTNDFGKQEPGSNAEVADFCERTYKVKFAMLEKQTVVATGANPLHEALFKATGDRPKWNFHKFLISRDGKTVKSYSSRVAPDAPELGQALSQMLEAQ